MENTAGNISRASWISIIGNLLLSFLKIFIGIVAGSLAVVGDGIDSATDILTSLITLFTARIMSRPPNAKYPYGYAKADTIAARLLAFVIFLAGFQLAYSTIMNLIRGEERNLPESAAIYITIISIIGKIILSVYLFRVSKKTNSNMLKANAVNMKNDVILSSAVLVSLFLTFRINLPLIDTITALLVSLWIIYSAFRIFMQTNIELMDGYKDSSPYLKIFEAVKDIEGAHNPHRVRVRKLGHMLVIGIDIEVEGSKSLDEAHDISMKVEKAIRTNVENVYDIVVHVEPIGNYEKHEKFGLSEADFKK